MVRFSHRSICVLWFYSCSELKRRQNYHFISIINSNSQIELQFSYSRSTYVNVNMCFPNRTFEGNFGTYVFESHFDIIETWKFYVGHRVIYYAKKILNSFICVEVRILVGKWNIYEAHIFPGHCNKHADWNQIFCV